MKSTGEDDIPSSHTEKDDKWSLLIEKLLKCLMGITSSNEGLHRFLSTRGWRFLNKTLEEECDNDNNIDVINEEAILLLAIIGQTCLQHASTQILEKWLEEPMIWLEYLSRLSAKLHSKLKFQLMDILASILNDNLPPGFMKQLGSQIYGSKIFDMRYSMYFEVAPHQSLARRPSYWHLV